MKRTAELIRALLTNYIKCFKMFRDIEGRASRFQFWGFISVTLAIAIVLEILFLIEASLFPLVKIYIAATFLPLLTVIMRRMHDVNESAWMLLWTAIVTTAFYFGIRQFSPFFTVFDFFGVVMALVILLFPLGRLLYRLYLPGTPYENPYGPAIRENKAHEQIARYIGLAMIFLYLSTLLMPLFIMMHHNTGTLNIIPLLF